MCIYSHIHIYAYVRISAVPTSRHDISYEVPNTEQEEHLAADWARERAEDASAFAASHPEASLRAHSGRV